MSDAQDRAEYEQYLKETGAKPEHSPGEKLKSVIDGVKEMGYLDPEKQTAAINNGVAMMVPSSGLAELLGAKLPQLATAAKIATPILEDGTIAAAQSPGHRGEAFVKGAGTSALMRGASAALNKGGDYLAQKAANIRDTKPGQGNSLMDQGVFGTKGMQKGQVSRKLGERTGELNDAVASIQDPISAAGTVKQLRDAAEGLKINGQVASNQAALHKQYSDLADSLEKMGQGESVAIAAPDMQKFKRAQGDVAHNASGLVPDTNVAAAAKLGHDGSRQAISDAYASSHPGQPNLYEDKNAALASLLGARKGLERKVGLGDLAGMAAMGGLGYAADGPAGAAAAALGKTSIAKSAGAYGARGGSKVLGALASPVSRTLTATPEDKDRAEYEQYLKETGQSQ